ncbi:SLC13 family permease [Sinimarinibacterium thermocellulolyticum]
MQTLALAVFGLTYLGMAAGGVRGLAVDRAWIALSGACLLLLVGSISGALPLEAALAHLDAPTLLLLLGLMLIAARAEASGLFVRIEHALAAWRERPALLLAGIIAVSGVLSAVLVNDIVAYALAPLLCRFLPRHGLDPRPFLIALALSCNAGSAASLIGNPQNALIGQAGRLDFWNYAAFAAVPALLSLLAVHAVVWAVWHRRWRLATAGHAPATATTPTDSPLPLLLALAGLLALLATPLPREIAVLSVALLLLMRRGQPSRELVARVDWNLLLLFGGLFVVTGIAAESRALGNLVSPLVPMVQDSIGGLIAVNLVGANLIGNVPLTVLLLKLGADWSQETLRDLALVSTLAGNALLIGSVVNLIVAERAKACGVHLGFGEFARCGLPVTVASMLIVTAWLVVFS